MALDENTLSRLDEARDTWNPQVVRISYRLVKQLLESRQRQEEALDYLRGCLEYKRNTVVMASEVYNRLTGQYFDPGTPDQTLLGGGAGEPGAAL